MATHYSNVLTAARWLLAAVVFVLAEIFAAVAIYVAYLAVFSMEEVGGLGMIGCAAAAGASLGLVVLLGAHVAPARHRWWITVLMGVSFLISVWFTLEFTPVDGAGSPRMHIRVPAAAISGILTIGVSLLAWPGLRPQVRRAILWLTTPLPVAMNGLAFLLFTELVSIGFVRAGAWVATDPILALAATVTVWLTARIAPSHRRWVLLTAAPSLVLLYAFLSVFAATSGGPRYPLVSAVLAPLVGAAVGAWLGLRRGNSHQRILAMVADGAKRRYKGMTPFQDAPVDRRTFFGRDRERRSLQSLVLAERLVVMFGKSGIGKTSLINAGLVEPLRERGYLPMVVRLADRHRGPLASLLDGVREAARSAGVDLLEGDDSSALTFFRTSELWSKGDDLLRPVLILDQFEELFTLHAPGPRRDFIRQLAELVRGPSAAGARAGEPGTADRSHGRSRPDLKIVLSLREDFLAELEELSREIPGVLRHRFRLGPFDTEAAREAIICPAALPSSDFDTPSFAYQDEAVDRIISFLARRRQGSATVEGAEVEPAHLQLVCQYLEESISRRQAPDGSATGLTITPADLGGEERLGGILEGFYDRTLASIRWPQERRRVRKLCERRLISEGGRRLTEDGEEIERKLGLSTERLRQLVDARLLRAEPRLGGVFYELSHDTLVEPIRRSRARRRLRHRGLAVGGVLVLGGWLGLWLSSVGWAGLRAKGEALVLEDLSERLPHPGDERAFEDLAQARLRRIQWRYSYWVHSPDLYGGMVLSLEEIRRHFPGLAESASEIHAMVRSAFIEEHGIDPPERQADEELNPRIPLSVGELEEGETEVADFALQAHAVTNREYRRFRPGHGRPGQDDEPAVGMTWYEAIAYSDWLGGRLPTDGEWEYAERTVRAARAERTQPAQSKEGTAAPRRRFLREQAQKLDSLIKERSPDEPGALETHLGDESTAAPDVSTLGFGDIGEWVMIDRSGPFTLCEALQKAERTAEVGPESDVVVIGMDPNCNEGADDVGFRVAFSAETAASDR